MKIREHNRWLILVAGVSILLCLGGGLYSWSIFILPLESNFNWTRAEVAVAFSLAILVFNTIMFIPGRILDIWGPRATASAAGIFCFAGYFFASRLDSLWELYLSYGVLVGLAISFGYISVITTILKWFPDKSGLASGLVLSGFGGGALFLSPVIAALIGPKGDWSKAFITLSIVFMLVILVAAQFLRNPPKDWLAKAEEKLSPLVKPNSVIKDFTWREMVRTAAFWKLSAMFCFGTAPGLLLAGHLAAFGQGLGYTVSQTTLMVSMFALGNAAGRVIWGTISDKIGRERTLFVMYGIQGFLYAAIAAKDIGILGNLFPLFIALLLFSGACYGGNFALMSVLNAHYFGTKHLGTNYGLHRISHALGILGPLLGGQTFVAAGSYFWAFITVAVVSLMMAGVALTTRAPLMEQWFFSTAEIRKGGRF